MKSNEMLTVGLLLFCFVDLANSSQDDHVGQQFHDSTLGQQQDSPSNVQP
jgi:hypothetical protein